MACPEETIQLWPAELWRKSLSSFQTGVIPIIWTTGQLPNPAEGDNDPWFGRLIPLSCKWFGNAIEITYNSGFYERGNCLIAIPKIKVVIQGFCLWGVNNVTIEVRAGNRRFFYHFISTNRSLGYFYSRDTLFAPPCGRRYSNTFPFGFEMTDLALWLSIVLDYSLFTDGFVPPWWQQALELDPFELFEPCSGCEYGFLESLNNLGEGTWESLQLDAFETKSFPLKRNTGQVKVTSCPNSIALVVNTDTGDADRYIRIRQTCDDVESYVRSELFISDECFIEEEDPDKPIRLPKDEDERWVPDPLPQNTCYRQFYDSYLGDYPPEPFTTRVRKAVGSHNGHLFGNDIPIEYAIARQQFDPYVGENGISYYHQSYYSSSFQVLKYHTKYEYNDDYEVIAKRTTEVQDFEVSYHLDTTTNETNRATNNAAVAKLDLFSAARQAYIDSPDGCDAEFTFRDSDGPPPPPPPLLKEPEERLNLDGKCFVKGIVSIGIKYDVEFTRIFKKLGPEVQEWAIRKVIPQFIPTAVRIPFKFQLPQGTSKIGGTQLTITGTFIQIGIGSESMTINIEEIFAYYNLVDDTGILGLLIPGPVSINNLESFCEL